MFNPDELIYLTAAEIAQIHDSIIADSGGLAGARPDLSVAALLGRIESNLTYQQFNDIAQIATLHAEVIAKGHVFLDGNKRTALVTMLTFLELNGYTVVVDQIAVADKIVDIAEGKLSYRQFAIWLAPKLMRQ